MQIHELNTFSGKPDELDFLAIDSGFDTAKISAKKLLESKINQPIDENNQYTNGNPGQLLRTKGDGSTEWSNVGQPTDAQTAQAVSDWLDDHPEATTTVQDWSLNYQKLIKGTLGFVSPEMFGAVGDGVTDDTQAWTDMLNFGCNIIVCNNATYLISDILDINSKIIFGNNATIRSVQISTAREHFAKITGTNLIKDLNFSLGFYVAGIGLFDCDNSAFVNVSVSYDDNIIARGIIDCYTNNHNILFDNIRTKMFAPNEEGGVWVREYYADKTTDNIRFVNCYFNQVSKDEIFAAWNWNGTVSNVFLNNCYLEGGNDSRAFLLRSGVSNFVLSDSTINGAYSSSLINVNTYVGTYAAINNCIINNLGTGGICESDGIIVFNNCQINMESNAKAMFYSFNSHFYNCIIKCKEMRSYNAYLVNCEITETGTSPTQPCIQQNCYIKGCKIVTKTSGMFINRLEDTSFTTEIIDSIIENDTTDRLIYDVKTGANNYNIRFCVISVTKVYITNANTSGKFYFNNVIISSTLGSSVGGIAASNNVFA